MINRPTPSFRFGLDASRQRCRSRAGVTIFECVTALFVVGIAVTTVLQLFATASRQLRRYEDRDRALLAASNVLERVVRKGGETSLPRLAADGEREWPEKSPLLAGMPAARILVETAGQRVRVSVVGPGERGARDVYATLTAWRFAAESPP
jgi:hypothetical protein